MNAPARADLRTLRPPDNEFTLSLIGSAERQIAKSPDKPALIHYSSRVAEDPAPPATIHRSTQSALKAIFILRRWRVVGEAIFDMGRTYEFAVLPPLPGAEIDFPALKRQYPPLCDSPLSSP